MLAELEQRADALEGRSIETVYFGGGTPSLWGAEHIAVVVAEAAARASSPLREVTVEANPEDLDLDLASALRAAGVDRLSLGIQSFDDETLRVLGRHHTGAAARAAVAAARAAGFERVSVDLIYAVPGEPADRLARDLDAIAALGDAVEHVSAYELTFEPGTALTARVERGLLAPQDEDLRFRAGVQASRALGALGFERYEVSSFARPGAASRHNRSYWSGDEYLGLGVGAHSLAVSTARVERSANGRNLRRFLDGRREKFVERLDPCVHLAELVMLGVRTSRGVDFASLELRFGVAHVAAFEELAARWQAAGHGRMEHRVYVPNPESLDLADLLGGESIALANEVSI